MLMYRTLPLDSLGMDNKKKEQFNHMDLMSSTLTSLILNTIKLKKGLQLLYPVREDSLIVE